MATWSLSAATYLLRTVQTPRVTKALFQEDILFDLPGSPDFALGDSRKLSGVIPYNMTAGGQNLNWPVEYASGSAETFTEGQVAQAPQSESLTQATLTPQYFRTVLKINGETLDACRDEGELVDVMNFAMDGRLSALRDTINTTVLGTGTNAIQTAIDYSSTYAGISSRATYGFDSTETAHNAALSLSVLEDTLEACVLRGGDTSDYVWLTRHSQVTNAMNLAGWAGNSVVQKNTDVGGKFDPSFIRTQISVCGVPVIGCTSLTSTVWLLIHLPSLSWYIHKPLTIYEKTTQDYSFQWHLITSLFLKVENPRMCAKITGVTA